jgi:hypothetical protein
VFKCLLVLILKKKKNNVALHNNVQAFEVRIMVRIASVRVRVRPVL